MMDRSSLPLAGALETTSEDFLELLRMLAHRLSQPLTSLRGSVEVALMGELGVSECRQVLELALQESHRMADALDTLRGVLEMEGSGEQVQPVSWTRRVEELLEQAASVDRDCGLQLVSDVQEGVWVKASPQHLDGATARLIAGAIRAARGNRLVRISLSAGAETACLSVCEEVTSLDAEAGVSGPPKTVETPVLGGLDQWVVRRAIERQGGGLKITQDSETCCYQLSLPLAMPEIAGKVMP
jgi:signal transduction histidine kinase